MELSVISDRGFTEPALHVGSLHRHAHAHCIFSNPRQKGTKGTEQFLANASARLDPEVAGRARCEANVRCPLATVT